jgi:hypothetical protein
MGQRADASPWLLPRQVLLVALPVSLGLLVPLVLAYVVSGPAGSLAVTLGFSGALLPALMLPVRWAAGLCLPVATAGAVGVAVNGVPFAAACVAALACLLVAPANTRSNGVLAGLPTVVAVVVATPGRLDAFEVFGWMLASGLVAVLLVSLLRQPVQQPGIPSRTAWLHASAMAVAVGLSVFVVTWQQLPRGFWVPMTMTVVLRPLVDETRRLSRQRITGTLLGAVLAVAVVALVPRWASIGVGLGLLVALVGYGLLDRYAQQVTVLTPLIIVLGSAGAGAALGVAAERVAYTAIGVLLAAAIALALVRWGRTDVGRTAGAESSA